MTTEPVPSEHEALAALHDFVARWLYNGLQGHMGPPPPVEARKDLDLDAETAVAAILASDWLAQHTAAAKAQALREAASVYRPLGTLPILASHVTAELDERADQMGGGTDE